MLRVKRSPFRKLTSKTASSPTNFEVYAFHNCWATYGLATSARRARQSAPGLAGNLRLRPPTEFANWWAGLVLFMPM